MLITFEDTKAAIGIAAIIFLFIYWFSLLVTCGGLRKDKAKLADELAKAQKALIHEEHMKNHWEGKFSETQRRLQTEETSHKLTYKTLMDFRDEHLRVTNAFSAAVAENEMRKQIIAKLEGEEIGS